MGRRQTQLPESFELSGSCKSIFYQNLTNLSGYDTHPEYVSVLPKNAPFSPEILVFCRQVKYSHRANKVPSYSVFTQQ